jgi:hypothetical protein
LREKETRESREYKRGNRLTMKEEKAKRNTRGEGKSSNLCLRYLKQQHRRPELLFISHVLSQASKAPPPPRHVTLLSHPTSPSSSASSPPTSRTNIILQAGGWEGESNKEDCWAEISITFLG